MQRMTSQHTTLNVLGFAIGSGLAGFVLRLLVVPAGLVGRASMAAEGDIGAYVTRAFVLAVFSGIAGASIAAAHNEFAKRG